MKTKRKVSDIVLGCLLALVALAIILPVLFLVGFFLGRDYDIPLEHGYILIRLHGRAIALADHSRHPVIPPSVDGYKVYRDFIVGHVNKRGLLPEEAGMGSPGYFIVDVRTDEVSDGLSKKQWASMLRARGIPTAPDLHRPSRWDNSIYRRYTRADN